MSVGETATGAANLVYSTWRGLRVRQSLPPTAAPSPQPTKPARIVRRPMALDGGTSHSIPTTIPQAQAPHPLPAPAPSNFQTVVVATTSRRRTFPRPKSLQNSRRWRGFASSSNPSDVAQSPRFARIDICVKVTRMALNFLTRFGNTSNTACPAPKPFSRVSAITQCWNGWKGAGGHRKLGNQL